MLLNLQCVNEDKLCSGDLIFCSYGSNGLTKSIDEVTQTRKNTHYSHMGIVEINNDTVFVIHATGKRGVVKEPLSEFLSKETPSLTDVYRIQNNSPEIINNAIKTVNGFLGLPYNRHYRMNDTCFYCSQLIYEGFKSSKVFQLEPMTFKNPNSDRFNKGWVKHYEELGMEIPEGEPGCNPNGMAASKNIRLVFRLK